MKKISDFIILIKSNEVKISYRWNQNGRSTRTTFEPEFWIDVIFDYLYFGMKIKYIEQKYVKYRKNIRRNTNSMYTCCLLQKMELDIQKKDNHTTLQIYFSKSEIKNWIIYHIKTIIKKYYDNTSKNGKKVMDEFLFLYK